MNRSSSRVQLAYAIKNHPLIAQALEVFPAASLGAAAPPVQKHYEEFVPHFYNDPTHQFTDVKVLSIPYQELRSANLSKLQRRVLTDLLELTQGIATDTYASDVRKSFDLVIRSTGWKMDSTVFDKSVPVEMQVAQIQRLGNASKSIYPSLHTDYQSVSTPHLYFAGANTHGLDRWRYQASGGFLHGYRFTCRTLFHILEEKYYDKDWGSKTEFDWTSKGGTRSCVQFECLVEKVNWWAKLLTRVMTAAGPYEMIGGALVDGAVFDTTHNKIFYYEEMPEDLFHSKFGSMPRLTWGFYFGPVSFNYRYVSAIEL
jgi:hypothetical protein